MKVKFALYFEEPLLVSLYSEIQPLVTFHRNNNVVRLIQMPNRMSKHPTLTIQLMLVSVECL